MYNYVKVWIFYLIKFCILFCLLALFMLSCRTFKPVIESKDSFSGYQIYDQLMLVQPDIDTYSVRRININLKDGDEEINLRGSLRIKKDSLLLLSINAFAGIEAARILMTRDSLKILDRINNKYFLGRYDDPNGYFPFTIHFDMLQNIFFASSIDVIKDFGMIEDDNNLYFFRDDILSLHSFIDDSTKWLWDSGTFQVNYDREFQMRETSFHSCNSDTFARFIFNSYNSFEGYYLPEDIDIYFVTRNHPFSVNIKFNGIDINSAIHFPFNIPSSYKALN